jgi:hypothetical protein
MNDRRKDDDIIELLDKKLDDHIVMHQKDYDTIMESMNEMRAQVTEMHAVFTGLDFSARFFKWVVASLLSIGSLYLMYKGIKGE